MIAYFDASMIDENYVQRRIDSESVWDEIKKFVIERLWADLEWFYWMLERPDWISMEKFDDSHWERLAYLEWLLMAVES